MLHFHRFHERHRLAFADAVALIGHQLHHHALHRRGHRFGARRPLNGRLGGGGAGVFGGAEMQGRVLPLAHQLGHVIVDEAGVDVVRRHLVTAQQVLQKADVGVHALDTELAQRPVAAPHGGGVVTAAVHDQLGEQGVVVGAGAVAPVAEGVHAQAGAGGRLEGGQGAAGGACLAAGFHGLHINAQLHGEAQRLRRAGQAQVRQGGAAGHSQLRLHQVHAGDLFGDGVLHLQPGVGFDKGEAAFVRVHQKLEGAQAAVADFRRQPQGGVEQLLAGVLGERRAGRHLHQLLVAPLQAALALPQVDRRVAAVAEHLHFDMPGPVDKAFHIDGVVTEGGAGFRLAALERLGQIVAGAHDAHAAAAAAGDRLDDHGGAVTEAVAECLGLFQGGVGAGAGDHRHLALLRQHPGAGLVAEQGQGVRVRADEDQAGVHAGGGEIAALAEKAVTRMHRVAALLQRDLYQLLAVQIGGHALPGQRHRPVRHPGVQGPFVIGGVDRHGGDVQVRGGAGDAYGDFAAVGNQQLFNGHEAGSVLFWGGYDTPRRRPGQGQHSQILTYTSISIDSGFIYFQINCHTHRRGAGAWPDRTKNRNWASRR